MAGKQLILDRYRPMSEAGAGGFATVQVAWDTQMRRKVAIKCIELPKVSPDSLSRVAPAELPITDAYHIDVVKNTATETSTALDTSVLLFDAAPAFAALLDDKAAGVPVPVMARRFHDAFVRAAVMAAQLVESLYGITTVALSGGVFLNRYLIEHVAEALQNAGFTVALNRDLPPSDGCISYGQAVVAWAANKTSEPAGE